MYIVARQLVLAKGTCLPRCCYPPRSADSGAWTHMTRSQRILSPQRMPIPPYPLTLWTSLKSIILTSNVISLYCILITCYCYNRLQPTIRFRSLAITKSYTRDYGSLSFCHLLYPLLWLLDMSQIVPLYPVSPSTTFLTWPASNVEASLWRLI